ncbi:uncharacterized protein UV8b_03604 [Ustilaginoidea virens]|uniref:Uncharacterized protein n=1 Tax=Ustilaginoidea virens TaxID=1159556 RepID=A0A8E5HQ33_USTVR|nr:uncharacterized protein UV8b_03604 [Ustilaginoidea virens]QUC19363.1 hypothetical protein UV8b_03604 [Ustilaginoidea virens]
MSRLRVHAPLSYFPSCRTGVAVANSSTQPSGMVRLMQQSGARTGRKLSGAISTPGVLAEKLRDAARRGRWKPSAEVSIRHRVHLGSSSRTILSGISYNWPRAMPLHLQGRKPGRGLCRYIYKDESLAEGYAANLQGRKHLVDDWRDATLLS